MNTQSLSGRIISGNFWVFIAGLFAAVLYALLPVEYSLPFFIVFSGLLLGAFIISSDSPRVFDKVFFLFLAGFVIRILIALFLYFTLDMLNANEGFFVGDGKSYSLNGWKIAKLWELGVRVNPDNFIAIASSFNGAVSNYDFLNAIIYYFSAGYNPVILFFINCLASSLSIVLIYLIANKIFSDEIAWLSAAFCAFLPSFILWGTQNLKDPLTNLCVLSFLYFLIKLRSGIKVSSLLFLLLSIVCLYYMRVLFIAPVALIVTVYFLLCSKVKIEIKTVCVICAIALGIFVFKDLFMRYAKMDILEAINTKRQGMAYGNLAYFSNFKISSIGSLLIYMPLGFIAVWFSPFPWQMFSVSQILVAPEVFIWYLFLPFAVKGIHFAIKNKISGSYLILITIFVFSVFLGVYESNLGTLYRHKAVVIMLAYIFISAGLMTKKVEPVYG